MGINLFKVAYVAQQNTPFCLSGFLGELIEEIRELIKFDWKDQVCCQSPISQSPPIPFFAIPIRYWYFQSLKIPYWYYSDTFQDLELRYRYYTDTFIVWSFDTDTKLIPKIKYLIPRVINKYNKKQPNLSQNNPF